MKEVVHVETQEQYDYVTEKLNYNWNENKWLDERENTCLIIDEKIYSSINYHKKYGNVKIISFEEFKLRYEPQLKIGDTFEKDGFVCRVLHQIDEKRWFRLKSPNNKDVSYEKLDNEGLKDINHLYTKQEITDQEFIKQLEIHSK